MGRPRHDPADELPVPLRGSLYDVLLAMRRTSIRYDVAKMLEPGTVVDGAWWSSMPDGGRLVREWDGHGA